MNQHLQPDIYTIPFGIYEKALPKRFSWEERLSAAAQTGYDFLEISIDDSDERITRLDADERQLSEIKNAIENTGIRIQSMSLSAHRRFPLGSEDKDIRQKGLDILSKAINFSLEIGVRYILIAGSDVYHQESNPKTLSNFMAGLEFGFQKASAAGLMLALENWEIRINSLKKAMEYVHYFNSPWFQLYVDIGNLSYAGYDIFEELEYAKEHIAALHVKDTIPGQLRYVNHGEGVVPFKEIFKKLAEIGFQAPIVLELWTEDFPDALEIVAECNTWYRQRMIEGWSLVGKKLMKQDEIR
jgi:L-ribulose-5-phosphate 3-epimerase